MNFQEWKSNNFEDLLHKTVHLSGEIERLRCEVGRRLDNISTEFMRQEHDPALIDNFNKELSREAQDRFGDFVPEFWKI